MRNRIHSNEKIVDIHDTLGLENDGSLTSAVILNHVEDWYFAHADLTVEAIREHRPSTSGRPKDDPRASPFNDPLVTGP